MAAKRDSQQVQEVDTPSRGPGNARNRVVIVGGGIAGVTCAQTLAGLRPEHEVVVISASALLKVVSNLKKSGRNLEQFDVSEQDKAQIQKDFPNIQVIQEQVTGLNVQKHELRLFGGRTLSYHKLCLCAGGRPHLIEEDNKHVIGIRDIESVDHLQQRLTGARRVVIVGNGGIATELVYELSNCQVIWVVKDKSIGATFFDPGAALFFRPRLEDKRAPDPEEPSKRLRYSVTSSKTSGDLLGSALGPDWVSDLTMKGRFHSQKDIKVEYECQVVKVYSTDELPSERRERVDGHFDGWPAFAELSNGKVIGCDFVVSATGVEPNSELFIPGNNFEVAPDKGLKVNQEMLTSEMDVYAAGDICTPSWEWAEHWFQMRLWTQARQLGAYAGLCISSHLNRTDPLFHFNFELFTHMTRFFGFKVVLLGLFNGQKLGNDYEVQLRATDGEEYVKVILKEGRMKGAILVGETDLEETFEHLILDAIDLTPYGGDLLDPSVDLEDYFD